MWADSKAQIGPNRILTVIKSPINNTRKKLSGCNYSYQNKSVGLTNGYRVVFIDCINKFFI